MGDLLEELCTEPQKSQAPGPELEDVGGDPEGTDEAAPDQQSALYQPSRTQNGHRTIVSSKFPTGVSCGQSEPRGI